MIPDPAASSDPGLILVLAVSTFVQSARITTLRPLAASLACSVRTAPRTPVRPPKETACPRFDDPAPSAPLFRPLVHAGGEYAHERALTINMPPDRDRQQSNVEKT